MFPINFNCGISRVNHSGIISIAIIGSTLFLINQLMEFILILVFETNYSDLCRWDCRWYSFIVEYGYDIEPFRQPKMDAANWAFFPFLPLSSRLFSVLTHISPTMSLLVVSKFLFLLSIFAFMKMAKEYSSEITYLSSGSAVVFSPYAIYGNVGYTEPAFLLFSALFFLYLKKEKYISAALIGSILTSVRFAGIFSLMSYIISATSQFRRNESERLLLCWGFLLIPLGLACFMFYLYWLCGDALAFMHIQRAWGREPGNPLNVILNGLHGTLTEAYFASLSIVAFICVALLALKKQFQFAIFSFFCTIVPLSTGLAAMPRYIFWQAPMLFLMANLLSRKEALVFTLPFFTFIQAIMYWAWLLSGRSFVI